MALRVGRRGKKKNKASVPSEEHTLDLATPKIGGFRRSKKTKSSAAPAPPPLPPPTYSDDQAEPTPGFSSLYAEYWQHSISNGGSAASYYGQSSYQQGNFQHYGTAGTSYPSQLPSEPNQQTPTQPYNQAAQQQNSYYSQQPYQTPPNQQVGPQHVGQGTTNYGQYYQSAQGHSPRLESGQRSPDNSTPHNITPSTQGFSPQMEPGQRSLDDFTSNDIHSGTYEYFASSGHSGQKTLDGFPSGIYQNEEPYQPEIQQGRWSGSTSTYGNITLNQRSNRLPTPPDDMPYHLGLKIVKHYHHLCEYPSGSQILVDHPSCPCQMWPAG